MKKALMSVALVCLLSALVTGCSNNGALSDRSLRAKALNGTYRLGFENFTLAGGKTEKAPSPGSQTKVSAAVFGQPVLGDLNGDGWNEAALLISKFEDHRTYHYVAAMVKDKATGKFGATNTIQLGDSQIAPQGMTLRDNTIVVSYGSSGPALPGSEQPPAAISRTYTIHEGTLVEIR